MYNQIVGINSLSQNILLELCCNLAMSGDGKLLLPYFFLSFLPCLVLFLYFYNHLSNIASSRRLFISYVLREISVSSYLGDR